MSKGTKKGQKIPIQPVGENGDGPELYELRVNREQLEFLLVLCTNAQVRPARAKQVCGELQELVEEVING